MTVNLRALVFGGVAAVFSLIGIYLHGLGSSNDGSLDPASRAAVDFEIYESNPDVPLSVIVTVSPPHVSPADDDIDVGLQITASRATTILVVSDKTNGPNYDPRLEKLVHGDNGSILAYGTVLKLDDAADPAANSNDIDVPLPPSDLVLRHGEVSIRMPSIGSTGTGTVDGVPEPMFGSFVTPNAYSYANPLPISDVYLVRSAQGSQSYANDQARGTPLSLLFSAPAKDSIQESLDGVGTEMTDSSILANYPSNGTLKGDDFVWSSDGSLDPVLSAVSRRASEAKNNDEFIAGIAFGTAGAGLVALLQEIPRRSDKDRSSGPEDGLLVAFRGRHYRDDLGMLHERGATRFARTPEGRRPSVTEAVAFAFAVAWILRNSKRKSSAGR